MAMKQVCGIVLLLPAFVLCAGKGASCENPNGESAKCIPFNDCKVLKDALTTQNASAIQFAQKSQCGYDSQPLVCCGTIAFTSARGSSCTTPDREKAKCKELSSCKPVSDRIKIKDRASIEFARNSQCGYDLEPLVCCGEQKTASIVSSYFPDKTVCGFEKEGDRVFGGEITAIDEHPWMALLGYRYPDKSDAGFNCGGTLINKRYVLTAAHCVYVNSKLNFELDYVRLGEWNKTSEKDCNNGTVNEECALPVVDIKIEKEVVHREYNGRKGQHDIALLRLQTNVAFTDYVRPICLLPPETSDPDVGTYLTVVGWGLTENGSDSAVKLKAQLPLLSRSVCSQKVTQKGPTTEDHVCAGGESGKDSCTGDSGGPLMAQFSVPNGIRKYYWYQEAIVSYGVVCGRKGIPAVYTRVTRYINWMKDNMTPF